MLLRGAGGRAGLGAPRAARADLVRHTVGTHAGTPESHLAPRRCRCLFESFIAIREGLPIQVQLGEDDAHEFRRALNRGGMARVQSAIEALDARDAAASVAADRAMILREIERTTGVEEFNARVREGLLAEFRRISTSAGLR